MKKKRVLAMVLAASLMFSQSAFAAEPVQTPQSEETTVNKEEQTQTEEENPVVPEEEKEEQAENPGQTEEQTQPENNSTDVQLPEESEESETDSTKIENNSWLTENSKILEESNAQSAGENDETKSEELEVREQSYNTDEASEKYILYLDYPVIFKTDFGYGTNEQYELSISDNSICNGSIEKTSYYSYCQVTLGGLKEGTTILTLEDSAGEILDTIEVEVKAKLPDDAVLIKDIALRSQLLNREKFEDDGYISYDEMNQITSLSLSQVGSVKVEDLSGLQYANNLEYLYIAGTNVTDISVLTTLKNLSILHLENTNVEDITALGTLINLKYLYLQNTNVADISALSNLTNLEYLYLTNTDIADISGLRNLKNLHYLDLKNCSNLESIHPLYELNNLQSLYLSGTQISDEEKMEMIGLYSEDMSMVKGQIKYLPAIYGMLEDTDVFHVEVSGGDAENVEVENFTTNREQVLAKEKGTVQLTLSLNDVERKITINIDGISAEQEVGETVDCDVEYISEIGSFENGDGKPIGTAAILSNNGDLWQTYPEVKKRKSNIKKYVSEWVYSGTDAFICDYSLDKNGVLWSGDTKLAEDIKEVRGHYALNEDNVLIDIYNDDSIQMDNVKDWVELSENPNWGAERSTYVLKNDGSLWVREEVEKEAEANEFQKVADDVVQVTYNGYLLGNGELLNYNGEVIMSNVESIHDSYYYGTDGNCYIRNPQSGSDYINIGKHELKTYVYKYVYPQWSVYYCFLTTDGELYSVDDDGTVKMLSKNILELWSVLLLRNGTYEFVCKSNDGTYYKITDDTLSSEETITVQSVGDWNLVINQGENYGTVERNGIPILSCVKKIWEDFDSYYALRTDGTIWKIDGVPELYIDLNESPVQSGDLNGDDSINITDLMMCLYYVSGRTALDSNAMLAADVNGDGAVTIIDLMRILYYVSGRNATL